MNCSKCGVGEIDYSGRCGACGYVYSLSTSGRKDDNGKARWDLLPWRQVQSAVDVLTFGAKKYADNNWQKVENPRERYFAAAQRHIADWRGGEKNDPESGLPHLAHAVCCLIFMMWFDEQS